MTEVVKVRPVDAVFFSVDASPGVCTEIWERFSFKVPGYQHTPAYKKGRWSGDIRLFKLNQKQLYTGLLNDLADFCRASEYELDLSDMPVDAMRPLFVEERENFVRNICQIPSTFTPRPYQWEAFDLGSTRPQTLFVSPTSSGKSLIMYMLFRRFQQRTLIVVPNKGLVHQMAGDFKDYGFNRSQIHILMGGEDPWPYQPRTAEPIVTISTWQSAVKQNQEWFDQFRVVLGDEAHLFTAKSLGDVMERLTQAQVRLGFTGTLSGSKTHEMVLRGFFGPKYQVITTAELVEQGFVAKPKIHVVKLIHPKPQKRVKEKYSEEYSRIITCEARNRFITNLATSVKGNTLILCRQKEKQAAVLQHMFDQVGRPIHYIDGGVEALERDEIRHLIEKQDDAILLATYGTTSTGVNIRRIHNLIFASPNKGRIINLQSLGRGLRIGDDKNELAVYDIADDMCWVTRKGTTYPNYGFLHMMERIKYYAEEQHDYKVYPVKLNY